jgi:hypothetical protein
MPPLEAVHQRPQQQSLGFGPVQDFDVLHGLHDGAVAVCTRDVAGWHEGVFLHGFARTMLAEAVTWTDSDVYFSQNSLNPYRPLRRFIGNIQHLTSCWVDVDFYAVPELRDLESLDVYERIMNAHPWLPEPTTVKASGRGLYLSWVFNERVHAEDSKKARWLFAMDRLTELLKPFGADANAKDLTRVLRPAGSINQKNGAVVALVTNVVGQPVKFGAFTDLVIDQTNPPNVVRLPNGRRPGRKPSKPLKRVLGKPTQSAYRLHYDRMTDYATLVRLRGGKLTDGRKRMMFWFSVSAAWTCTSTADAIEQTKMFVQEHFDEPDRYIGQSMTSAMHRMEQAEAGVTLLWNGQARDIRYKARTATLIERLEVTAEEQRHMVRLKGPEEWSRHKAEKADIRRQKDRTRALERRRQAGMVPQAEYTQREALRASERRSEALRLRALGQSAREIAASLNVAEGTVWRYLK